MNDINAMNDGSARRHLDEGAYRDHAERAAAEAQA